MKLGKNHHHLLLRLHCSICLATAALICSSVSLVDGFALTSTTTTTTGSNTVITGCTVGRLGCVTGSAFPAHETVHAAAGRGHLPAATTSTTTTGLMRRNRRPAAVAAPPSSLLYMSNTPISPEPPVVDENLREEDPIEFLAQEVKVMDVNAIINTAIIVLIALAVLNQVATVDADLMRGWTAQEMAVRIPVDNWQSYSAVLEKSPLATKAVTSATVYTIGDFIAQRTEGLSMGELDRSRLFRSLLAGLIGHGPLSHLWFDISEDVFENVMHLRDWWGTIVKVVIDQTTWGPFWNNTYILLLGLMKMDKLENIWGEMKRTTIPLIVSGLKLWPLAHCITYGLVPVENRLLWVDLVEIIWVTILATAAAGSDAPENNSAEQQQQQQQQNNN